MKKILLLLILSISSFSIYASEKGEDYYIEKFCNEMSGESKKQIKVLSRNGEEIISFPDCLTDTHAFEFEWAEKMQVYEAIGQSLYYSSATGRKPGILLIIRKENPEKHVEKVLRVIEVFDLPIKLMLLDTTTEEISELSE